MQLPGPRNLITAVLGELFHALLLRFFRTRERKSNSTNTDPSVENTPRAIHQNTAKTPSFFTSAHEPDPAHLILPLFPSSRCKETYFHLRIPSPFPTPTDWGFLFQESARFFHTPRWRRGEVSKSAVHHSLLCADLKNEPYRFFHSSAVAGARSLNDKS